MASEKYHYPRPPRKRQAIPNGKGTQTSAPRAGSRADRENECASRVNG
jgi:hypothetical protein